MKNHFANSSGFTLLELLVAVCLLSIGIFSVISMQVTAIKSNSIANTISTATALGQQAMDDILSYDISDTRINNTTANAVYDLNGPNNSGNSINVSGAGDYCATYSTTVNSPVMGTTQIVVNIYKGTTVSADMSPVVSLIGYKRIT